MLLKSPDLDVLHVEVLLFGEHGVPECLTGVTPAVVEVAVQPQAELAAEERNKHLPSDSRRCMSNAFKSISNAPSSTEC